MKVLILSCSTGGGHNSCANYIKEELILNNIECNFIDFFDIFGKNAKKMSSDIYLKTLGNNGKIFKNVYKAGEFVSKSKLQSPVYLFNKMFKKKLYEYIQKNNYTLVITTHLFPSLTLTAINNDKKYKHIPFLFVATDYEPCPFMEEANPEYFIMQKTLENAFIQKGISETNLLNTGIPVSSNFIKNAKSIRREYNISDDENVILIMLGSMGFGEIDNIINPLLKENIKIIVICGTNKKLYKQLIDENIPHVIIKGQVNNMPVYMKACDVIYTKPGGLTSTEAAVCNIPIIHTKPIPGCETQNSRFFVKNGMSISAKTTDGLIKQGIKLFRDDKQKAVMIKNQSDIISKNGSMNIYNLVKNNMEK